MAKNFIRGNWSFRAAHSTNGPSFQVYPKGERSHWSVRASLYPASDGKCYVISITARPIDARETLEEAIAEVLTVLEARP